MKKYKIMMIKIKHIVFFLSLLLIWLSLPIHLSAIDTTIIQNIAEREEIERQEQQLNASLLVKKANQNFQKANYEIARDQCLTTIKTLSQISPQNKDTENKILKIKDLLSMVYTYWAEDILNKADKKVNSGQLEEAIMLCKQAAEVNPKLMKETNELIKKIKLKIKEKDYNELTSESTYNPGYKKKVYNIDVLYEQAKKLYQNKNYTKARDKLEELLALDPYNSKAIYYLKLVNKQIYYAGQDREAVTSDERAAQAQWATPTPILTKTMSGTRVDISGSEPILKHKITSNIQKKLDSIIIAHIAFEDVPVETALMYLKRESKKLDPEGKGVNIFLKINKNASSSEGDELNDEIWEEEDLEETATKDENKDGEDEFAEQFLITIALDDITLGNAIGYVCASANLKYTVGEYAVEIFSEDITPEMETVVFPVEREVFLEENVPETIITERYTIDLKEFFKEHGIKFPSNSSAIYDTRISRLIIRNTPNEINKVSKLVDKLNTDSPQISIASKFVEIRQKDFEELGFEWRTSKAIDGNKTSWTNNNQLNTFALKDNTTAADPDYDRALGVSYSAAGFTIDAVIHALDQNEKINVLSAPKVTTLSGEKAVIKMTTDAYYPVGWNPSSFTENTGSTTSSDVYIPPSPIFDKPTQNGIIFTVTPYVAADRYTIDLELEPQIQKFIGWTNYLFTVTDSSGLPVYPNLKMPKIKVQSIHTQLKVYDGETVVLGGILKDETTNTDDRTPFIGDVPLVGRLFRSQIEDGDKTNLLIFTKVLLIKPDGTPLRPQIDNGLPNFRYQ